jgi:hypothetical protein
MLQPNMIMAAFAPKMAMRVPTSWTPARAAMTTIMTLELKAYSIQRMGFWPRARWASYQRRAGNAMAKWAMALIRKNSATAGPMGMSQIERWAVTRCLVVSSKRR